MNKTPSTLCVCVCVCVCVCDTLVQSDVEEGQLSECVLEEEMGGGDSPLPRSSSTSDITQQLADTFPGKGGSFRVTQRSNYSTTVSEPLPTTNS